MKKNPDNRHALRWAAEKAAGVRVPAFERPGRTVQNTERRMEYAENCRQALELRKAGASYAQIATQLGKSGASWSHKAVAHALKMLRREPVKDIVLMELARLDVFLLALYPKAKAGDTLAIDRCLRIMERRSMYLGLDAPKKTATEFDGSITVTDGAHEELLTRLSSLTVAATAGEGDPGSEPH